MPTIASQRNLKRMPAMSRRAASADTTSSPSFILPIRLRRFIHSQSAWDDYIYNLERNVYHRRRLGMLDGKSSDTYPNIATVTQAQDVEKSLAASYSTVSTKERESRAGKVALDGKAEMVQLVRKRSWLRGQSQVALDSKRARVGGRDGRDLAELNLAAWRADLREVPNMQEEEDWAWLQPWRAKNDRVVNVEAQDLEEYIADLAEIPNMDEEENWGWLQPWRVGGDERDEVDEFVSLLWNPMKPSRIALRPASVRFVSNLPTNDAESTCELIATSIPVCAEKDTRDSHRDCPDRPTCTENPRAKAHTESSVKSSTGRFRRMLRRLSIRCSTIRRSVLRRHTDFQCFDSERLSNLLSERPDSG
jgi:hypothetical protein